MLKAIIFDCFGVLATEGWLPFKAKHFGNDPELAEQASNIIHRADRGLISHEAAIAQIAALAGISPTEFKRAVDRNVPNQPLFAYLRTLKTKYKLGFLSNISANYLAQIFTPAHLELFDAITLSFESGFIKPQPEAFNRAARELGVEMAECVMVDDRERNVTGARAAGMQTVLYQDVEQLKRELDKLSAN